MKKQVLSKVFFLVLGFGLAFSSNGKWRPLNLISPWDDSLTTTIKSDGQRIYTLARRHAYYTDNKGETWEYLSLYDDIRIKEIACSPYSNLVVVGGWKNSPWHYHFTEVYKSEDKGLTWQQMPSLPSNKESGFLFVSSDDDIYAYNGNLYKMRRGETEWQEIRAMVSLREELLSLVISPDNPNLIYLLVKPYGNGGWIYVSEDGGESWNQADEGIREVCKTLVIAGEYIYALSNTSIYKKLLTPGNTWKKLTGTQPLFSQEEGEIVTHDMAVKGREIYVTYTAIKEGTFRHLVKAVLTTGFLITKIARQDDGCHPPLLQDIVCLSSGEICIGGKDGLYKIKEVHYGELTLARAKNKFRVTGEYSSYSRGMAIGPERIIICWGAGERHKTTDEGETWKKINNIGTGGEDFTYVFAPLNENIVYISASDGAYYWDKSTDGGEHFNSWLKVGGTIRFLGGLAINPDDSNKIYVGVEKDDGSLVILKTSDGGENWREVSVGTTTPEGVRFSTILFNPQKSDEIYFKTKKALYKSIDAGETWRKIKSASNESIFSGINLDYHSPSWVYLTEAHREGEKVLLWKSEDGGMNWSQVHEFRNAGSWENRESKIFAQQEKIYLLLQERCGIEEGEWMGKIYMSEDEGRTWKQFHQGLPIVFPSPGSDDPGIVDLWYRQKTNTFYALFLETGIYQCKNIFPLASIDKSTLPGGEKIFFSCSNPFNPECYIPVNAKYKMQNAKCKIYNILGQVVREIECSGVQGGKSAMVYWDGRNSSGLEVPAGVYFYEVAGEGVRRVVVLK